MYSIATMCNLESARRARARTGIEWTSQVGSESEVRVYLTGRGPGEISWGDDTKTTFEWPQPGVAYTHLYEDGRQRLVECSVTGDITSLKVTSTIPFVLFRRLDAPSLTHLEQVAKPVLTSTLAVAIQEGCRIGVNVVSLVKAFDGNPGAGGGPLPLSFVLPRGLESAAYMFRDSGVADYVPLSFWPSRGFTSEGPVDLRGMFKGSSVTGSVAPSHLLWDSGRTFLADADTFNSSWLNHAGPYTDPESGMTFTKIPASWGGAPD